MNYFYMSFYRIVCVGCLVVAFSTLAFAQGVTKTAIVRHYSNNPEKLRAAEFLLTNMPYHRSVYSTYYDGYYKQLAEIFHTKGYPVCKWGIRETFTSLAPEAGTGIEKSDLEVLSAEDFFRNIDMAYDDWKNGPWAGHLSFDDFCEYLLPYRVGNENLSVWRKDARDKYLSRIDWIKSEEDKKHSAYWAACYLNDQIKHNGFHIDAIPHLGGIGLPYSVLKNMRMGECDDYATFAAYVMRACGVPVGVDFTPQWPFRSSGHYWNTLLDNSGKNIPFMGGESNPGYPCKAGYIMAKVYRKTFAYQHESLVAQNDSVNEKIPQTLSSPFIKDVSYEYFKGIDIVLPLNETQTRGRKFVYLSVFNNQEWVPVAYAKVTNDTATFKDMGPDIVYLPCYWGVLGAVGISNPILVRKNRTIDSLIPDKKHLQTLTLRRKFPVFGGVLYYSQRVIGGYFEAANSEDFRDAVVFGKITRNPQMRYDSLEGSSKKAYRYWRYVSPKKGHCNIAEIAFFQKGNRIEPQRTFSDGREGKGYQASDAFDRDELTFYQSKTADSCWIAADFGMPVAIDKIRYLPRNDDNNVVPGHLYRLDYYDGGKLVKGNPVTAIADEISFSDLPSHALFILHDLTKGKEERIFTVENGEVCWH